VNATTLKRIGLLLALGTIGATLPAAIPTTGGSGGSTCDAVSQVIKRGSLREAQTDYAFSLAMCMNETDDVDREECIDEAQDAFKEAVDLAHEQYDARLEVCALLGGGPYDPELDEDEFDAHVNNTYFPLVVGRTLLYEMHNAEGTESTVVQALHDTVEIDGAECRAVSDVVSLNGQVVEDTIDWYSQHEDGDVWYFGEISKSFDEDGFLHDLSGSWRTDVEGAKPGVIMFDAPVPGTTYRQEYLVNVAEDVATILSLDETVTVPAGTFTHCLKTRDWTPMEPDAIEIKYYAPGIGMVLEVDQDTGDRTELVQIN
jgi:hypothetical protein